ncbi:CCA tRNA nucleotidyltransferase [archaeon]|nr:CCA tRNA nucleotidyltransferase [archaeon]
MNLEKIIPKQRKKELALATEIITEINKQGHEAMLVGSIAKDTCLRGSKDIDIFIMFSKNTTRKKLEQKGLEIGKKVCQAFGSKAIVHYAEHPYTKTVIKGYDIDLVPCYKLKKGEKIISSVDRSPLHTHYVKKHLIKNNEVRMLKYFMKKIGVYGANIRVRGFSGYLCELLILKYGSFQNVLEKASLWKPREKIDLENHSTLEFNNPLIVIDPVDPERNVAAALHENQYCWFILAARYYIKHKKIPSKTKLMKKRGKFFVIEWKIKEDLEEILWSQLERFQEKVVKQLNFHELSVIDSLVWTDSQKLAQLLIELEVWELPLINDHEGPEAYDQARADSFIEKYGKVVVRGSRLYTEKKREYRKAEPLLKKLLKEPPSHLEKNWKIKTGATTKKTRVYKEYSKKFWKLT